MPKQMVDHPATQYVMGLANKNGKLLGAGKTYKIDVSKDMPVKQFWAPSVYDRDDDRLGLRLYCPHSPFSKNSTICLSWEFTIGAENSFGQCLTRLHHIYLPVTRNGPPLAQSGHHTNSSVV